MPASKDISQALINALHALGLSYQDIGDAVGKTRAQVYHWRIGKNHICDSDMAVLLKLLATVQKKTEKKTVK